MKKLICLILLVSSMSLPAIDPSFLTIRLVSSQPDLQIQLVAVATDSNQLLQTSTNLINWVTVAGLDFGTNEFLLFNPHVDVPYAFFRIKERGVPGGQNMMQQRPQPTFAVMEEVAEPAKEYDYTYDILMEAQRELHRGDPSFPIYPPTRLNPEGK